jgi:hypothetical protein
MLLALRMQTVGAAGDLVEITTARQIYLLSMISYLLFANFS